MYVQLVLLPCQFSATLLERRHHNCFLATATIPIPNDAVEYWSARSFACSCRSSTVYSSSESCRVKMIEKKIDLSEILKGKTFHPDDSDYVEALLLVDDRSLLGEGIIFDDRKHTVLWTDIAGKKFHSLKLDYEEPTIWTTRERTRKFRTTSVVRVG